MDITQLVARVMAALLPLLPMLAEEAVKESGKKIVSAPYHLYKLLQERFKRPSKAKQALEGLKAAPQDPAAQAFFREQLADVLRKDRDFRGRVEEVIGSISQASGDTAVAGSNSTINQSKIQNIGSTILNFNLPQIPAEVRNPINFVISVQGEGAGTIGQALAALPPLRSALPSVSRDAQGRDVYGALSQLFTEYGPDIDTDLALIAKVLQPAITAEHTEASRRPGRFLRRIATEIGQALAEIQVFDSDYYVDAYADREITLPMDPDGYQTHRLVAKLHMPTLAEAFAADSQWLTLNRTIEWREWADNDQGKTPLLRRVRHSLLSANKEAVRTVSYNLNWDRWLMLPETDEYHLVIRQSAQLLTAEVLAKFIRAILHDYLVYMRPQVSTSVMLERLSAGLTTKPGDEQPLSD